MRTLTALVLLLFVFGCERAAPIGPLYEHERKTWTSADLEDRDNKKILLYETVTTDRNVYGAVFSWNVTDTGRDRYVAEIAVAPDADGPWSRFMPIANWTTGFRPFSLSEPPLPKPVESKRARVEIDELVCTDRVRAVRIRVLTAIDWQPSPESALSRADLTLTFGRPTQLRDEPAPDPVVAKTPFRYNSHSLPELRSRLCSPISLSMLLEQRGVSIDLDTIAQTVYDREHDIYGNWVRAIQAAYSFGVPGYLTRFGSWAEVSEHLATVGPIAISITTEEGELRGAPYPSTGGHLIVLYGIDNNGDAMVIDPAVSNEDEARLIYKRDDLTNVWLNRKMGTAYVLLPKDD